MKIPKQLRIAGLTWEVKEDNDVSREGNCYGSTHHTTQKIFLEPKLSIQKRDSVFLHEILHGVWNLYGLGANKKYSREDEELIIDSIANGLYQVLTENNLLK